MTKTAILFLTACSLAAAQAPAPKDRAGCQDSKILSRIPGCRILSCQNSEYGVANLRVGKASTDRKNLEGAYERLNFQCPAGTTGVQVYRNAENAFKAAGYNAVYTNNYGNVRYTLVVQKGPQWAQVSADGLNYELITLKTKELDQVMEASGADAWAKQIEQTGRVSIYGINFDTAKATIRPDSEKVLAEVAALLQKQPDWYLAVAGHTDNVGSDATNLPLSRQRAEAVIAWLAAKGIDRARLTPLGFGVRKPVADNSTEEGRAKNRRVDLIKLY